MGLWVQILCCLRLVGKALGTLENGTRHGQHPDLGHKQSGFVWFHLAPGASYCLLLNSWDLPSTLITPHNLLLP